MSLATIGFGACVYVGDLGLEAFKGVAILHVNCQWKDTTLIVGMISHHEIIIGYSASILLGVITVSALEDLRPRPARQNERLRLQRVVMELVEIALVSKFVLCPDALQALDEFAAATVAFGVVEPPLSNTVELLMISMEGLGMTDLPTSALNHPETTLTQTRPSL